jgi:hypothetical protein
MAIVLAIGLILLGALARVVGLPPGAAPLGAISLYAGARLPRRWAWIVPLAAMVASDLILDRIVYPNYPRSPLSLTRLASYATLAMVALLGGLRRGEAGPWVRVGMSVGASTLFYLTTNFAVWATTHGATYPMTAAGLLACYVAALPFYGNGLAADLAGTIGLFGVDALVRRAMARKASRRPALVPHAD